MKVAFLDRDGTIVKDYPDAKWTHVEAPEFLPESIEGLKTLRSKGYELIVVTNQYIINDGFITIDQYHDFTEKIVNQLKSHGIELLDIFYCAHSSEEGCMCKKPQIGMFEEAIAKYEGIDISKSLMIGDSECDKSFASNAELSFYGVKGGSLINQQTCYDSLASIAREL
jgi:D-glycero-D-manno-heptose 1,7-bisphosphate phosphatase